ncbi:MAG: DUF2244 domain-containing protein [Pseudomonadota bacterium]
MAAPDDMAAGEGSPAASRSEHPADPWAGLLDRDRPPAYSVELWPNRSLSRLGQRRVLALLGAGFALPLLPLVATPVLWIPLLFALAVLGLVAWAFRRNTADGRLVERLALWPDEMRVERVEPSGQRLCWSADPYFVRLTLHEQARLESYLTLKGGGREIELGAFLSPEERRHLAEEIETAIRAVLATPA